MAFMVTTSWRGAMRVCDLRSAETEEQAWRTAEQMERSGDLVKVYEIFPDKPPRLCKKPKE